MESWQLNEIYKDKDENKRTMKNKKSLNTKQEAPPCLSILMLTFKLQLESYIKKGKTRKNDFN